MINRPLFKKQNKKDRNGNRPCDNKKASDYPELMSELYYRQLVLSNSFTNWEASHAFRWIEGYANYVNKYGKIKLGAFNRTKDFNPWEIVLVDLFGSFKNEMEFDHPALILQVLTSGQLVVVPITSNKDTYEESRKTNAPKELVSLPKNIKKLGNMSKNSTLLLNHLKVISKNRVLQRKFEMVDSTTGTTSLQKLRIESRDTKNLINKKIAEIYSGSYIHESNVKENKLNKEIATLKAQLEDEKQKLEELQTKYNVTQAHLEASSDTEY